MTQRRHFTAQVLSEEFRLLRAGWSIDEVAIELRSLFPDQRTPSRITVFKHLKEYRAGGLLADRKKRSSMRRG